MNIRVISGDQLTPEHIVAWDRIQQANPSLESPYFRPEFTQAVAAVRNDVEVAVLEQSGEPVGFFPFQRSAKNVARPVGSIMSDFHGVIAGDGAACEPRQLLDACQLSAWHFDHLLAAQEPLQPYHWNVAPSPYIDLSNGWEGYQAQQRKNRKDWFKRALQKHRHAVREGGELRVEHSSTSPDVFQSLLKWKVTQYQRTQVTNVLAFDWTVPLLERILAANTEAFSGLMSALYMGNVLTAVLLSIRSFGVVHGWFSAYRPNFAPLSPGLVLWLEVLKAYPTLGIRRVHLGKGPEEYKRYLCTGAVDVAEGSVDLRPMSSLVRRNWRRAYDWA